MYVYELLESSIRNYKELVNKSLTGNLPAIEKSIKIQEERLMNLTLEEASEVI
jgi:hypothetical protein